MGIEHNSEDRVLALSDKLSAHTIKGDVFMFSLHIKAYLCVHVYIL